MGIFNDNSTVNADNSAGLTAIANAMDACCNLQYAPSDIPDITLPDTQVPYSQTLPDGSVVTGTVTCPGLTIPGTGGIQVPANQVASVWQTLLQYTASNTASNYQNSQFNDWLQEWQDYQNNTTIPYFAQLIASALLAIQAYEIYIDCLEIAKDAKECVRDEVVDMKMCVQDLRNALCQHYDELAAENVVRLTAWGEKGEWACGKRDEEWSTFISYRDKEQEHINSAFDKAHELICRAEASSESLLEFTAELEECFAQLKDANMSDTVADALDDIIAKLKDSCDWMTNCANELKDDWDLSYKDASANYSGVALNEANVLVQGLSDIDTFVEGCRELAKQMWATAYADKEAEHIPALLEEACKLAPCLSVAHGWFCEHADDMQEHWEEYWKPKEQAYVCDILDKALERGCELHDSLSTFCREGDGFLEHWKNCYEEIECIVSPKLIAAAERACAKQEELYTDLCERGDHLWDKFETDFCPCDTKDLLEVCAVWEKCHPINELCDNHECQQEIADVLKDCYIALTLPCEKAYIREVCEMQKYDPQYCEMESTALLRIKKQYDRQREQLLKGSSRYCMGATKQQLVELASQQAAAEAAAIATANRWEWAREVQECNRRHRYHMETLTQLGERHIDTSLRAYAQDTALLDQILGRIHERLVRGYEYVRNHNDFARSILGATQAAVQAGEQAMQIGQFWPGKYCEVKSEYDRSSLQYMNHGADLMRIGQFYPQQAASDKTNAANLAQGVAQTALNAYRVGQDHMRSALAMAQEQRAEAALASQAGEAAAARGLDQMRLAAAKMDNVLGAATGAISQGNDFVRNGLNAAAIARQGHESSLRASANGFQAWGLLSEQGSRHAISAGNFNNASMGQLANHLQMTCEFLNSTYCCLGNHFHQSGVGIARAAGAMMSDSRDALGQAGGDLIGAIGGLNQPPPFPQAPFGTYGTQTIGGNPTPSGFDFTGGSSGPNGIPNVF